MDNIQTLQEFGQDICKQEQNIVFYRKEYLFDPILGDFKLVDKEVNYNDDIVIEIPESIGEW